MGSPVDVFLSLRVIGLWHQPISMRIMAMNKKKHRAHATSSSRCLDDGRGKTAFPSSLCEVVVMITTTVVVIVIHVIFVCHTHCYVTHGHFSIIQQGLAALQCQFEPINMTLVRIHSATVGITSIGHVAAFLSDGVVQFSFGELACLQPVLHVTRDNEKYNTNETCDSIILFHIFIDYCHNHKTETNE